MKAKTLLSIVAYILVSAGLLWLFLPHAFHDSLQQAVSGEDDHDAELITQGVSEDEGTPHYVHILEGCIALVAGLGCAVLSNRIR